MRGLPIPMSQSSPEVAPHRFWLVIGAIVLLTFIAYHRTFTYPFHFDGQTNIQAKLAAKEITWDSFPTGPRSLVDLSWQLNHRIGGENTLGYHVVNYIIHVAASLLLLGFVYSTLRLPNIPESFQANALTLAATIAILWAIHPLQTQSVTYITQRYESLMGLFFLLTMVCLCRGSTAARATGWYVGCIAAGLAATLCKEVAIVLPLVMLWYDRAFLASSWAEILRKRWWVYGGVFCGWLILAQVFGVSLDSLERGGAVIVEDTLYTEAGVVRRTVGPLEYLYSQGRAIPFYLQLTLFPVGQSLDHGWRASFSLAEVIWPGIVVVLLLGLTIWAIFKAPRLSFLGGWFFLILAPTSSILPIRDIVFEHRMYLPLAAVLSAIVLGIFALLKSWEGAGKRESMQMTASQGLMVLLVLLVAIYGSVTIARNEVYRSDFAMWQDVIDKNPRHARAYHGMAHSFVMRDDWESAIPYLEKTIELDPEYAFKPYYGKQFFAGAKLALEHDNLPMAVRLLDLTIKMDPQHVDAYVMLSKLLSRQNRRRSVALLQLAVKIDPNHAEAQQTLRQMTQ